MLEVVANGKSNRTRAAIYGRERAGVMTAKRALLTWLLMIPVAFANGTVRELAYGPHVSESAAHRISCVTAVGAFAMLVLAVTRRWHFRTYKQACTVGLLWAGATIAFETALGLSRSLSWADMIHQYALWEGQLWALVVFFIGIAPSLSIFWDRCPVAGTERS